MQISQATADTTPIIPLTRDQLTQFLASASSFAQSWIARQRFTAKPETALAIPTAHGDLAYILAGVDDHPHIWSLAHVPAMAPAGNYHIHADWPADMLQECSLGIMLAQYQFDRYKKSDNTPITLALSDHVYEAELIALASATYFVRDLINTPANDMGPEALAEEARVLAESLGASFHQIVGDELLSENYPAIHAVGRAAAEAPRLIELRHGKASHPQVTLVGKGVCFDTGGLDIKPYSSMKLMKKDMGGAALVLGLAKAIIEMNLNIRLRVLIPAVENSVAGNAFRPQDIIPTRKGLSVEVGSTDAEGRVILCDALFEADQENPDLIIDVATLTGAARTALGGELPALFSNHDSTARTIMDVSLQHHDPMWHMPLWKGYDKYVNATIADITNSPNYPMAGAITAALYLNRFVHSDTHWVHIDSYAWNSESLPGRPAGGEALGLRGLYYFLKDRYGQS